MGGVSELAAARRAAKAKDDGRCATCGRIRAVCSPYGQPCFETLAPAPSEREPW
jgi:hypothetical protein